MSAAHKREFACMNRRRDPHDYEGHLPAHVEREMAEMRDTLNREARKQLDRRFVNDAPVSAFGVMA
jgi:hypothetical protein